jgi:8-oxo-dGTP pyrophosphatase MutT (NUDIX family)
MFLIDDIHRLLHGRNPLLSTADHATRAAVALILREGDKGPDVLFIQRARHRGDPWSGDLGFPGGKIEEGDGSARAAAERETLEEVGLDLGAGRYLGRLDDLQGAHLPVLVSCFVYAIKHSPPLTPSPEVTRSFWFPLSELRNPHRHLQATVRFGEEHLVAPAIRLLEASEVVLWGLTYRLVSNFLAVVKDVEGQREDFGVR